MPDWCRVAVRMFEQIQQAAEGVVFSVRASYLEIYNEQAAHRAAPSRLTGAGGR